MKPIYIALTNSKSFVLYNKELNNLFDELSKLFDSKAGLIHLQDTNIIPQLEKVLPKSLDVLTITRETIVLSRESAVGLVAVAEEVKFFNPYNDDFKKYTIKLL